MIIELKTMISSGCTRLWRWFIQHNHLHSWTRFNVPGKMRDGSNYAGAWSEKNKRSTNVLAKTALCCVPEAIPSSTSSLMGLGARSEKQNNLHESMLVCLRHFLSQSQSMKALQPVHTSSFLACFSQCHPRIPKCWSTRYTRGRWWPSWAAKTNLPRSPE